MARPSAGSSDDWLIDLNPHDLKDRWILWVWCWISILWCGYFGILIKQIIQYSVS